MSIITYFKKQMNPGKGDSYVLSFELTEAFIAHFLQPEFQDRLLTALVNRAVDEIWKDNGSKILKKIDKKTAASLSVKKLATLIAKEIANNDKSSM